MNSNSSSEKKIRITSKGVYHGSFLKQNEGFAVCCVFRKLWEMEEKAFSLFVCVQISKEKNYLINHQLSM
jgi:hypothetical protein